MSKFFKHNSDTDSDSDSSSSHEPEVNSAPFKLQIENETTLKRVVKSAEQKWQEEMNGCILQIRNLMKIKDFATLLDAFDNLLKIFGKETSATRPFEYDSCLVDLERFIAATWEDKSGRSALSKTTSKALVALRQKLRKVSRSLLINPSHALSTNVEASTTPISITRELSDNESDDSASSETESSIENMPAYGSNLREYFLKKTSSNAEPSLTKKHPGERKNMKKVKSEWQTVKDGVSVPFKDEDIVAENEDVDFSYVSKKLDEMLLVKSNKYSVRSHQLICLYNLDELSVNQKLEDGIIVKIKLSICNAIYRYNTNCTVPVKIEMWRKLLKTMSELIGTLLCGNVILNDKMEVENLETPPYKVHGSMVSLVELAFEEFTKIIKTCDPYGMEYVERIKDEPRLMDIVNKTALYLEGQGASQDICRIYLCKVSQLHYKFVESASDPHSCTVMTSFDRYCKYIYQNDESNILRTRAILFHIYFLAVHDKWLEARDLMLMSNLQENIHHSDVRTQIFFNRAMAQLGMCAFRQGQLNDAHNCLADLLSIGRAKEVLGQGFVTFRANDRSREQEQVEKQYQLPYHMHISIELMECMYLVSAMLIDVPYMATHEKDMRPRMISKAFYQQLRSSERQNLVGPPESMREHVVAASKALRAGKWRLCRDLLINPKMNAKIWKMVKHPTPVLAMISQTIQKSALQTFVFTYGFIYDSLSIPILAVMFELPENSVLSLVAKMVLDEALPASINAANNSLVFFQTNGRRVQCSMQQLADKLGYLVDLNERTLDRSNRQRARTDRQFHKLY